MRCRASATAANSANTRQCASLGVKLGRIAEGFGRLGVLGKWDDAFGSITVTPADGGAYRIRFVNATFRKAHSVWRLLGEACRRVAVLGVPGTYPP